MNKFLNTNKLDILFFLFVFFISSFLLYLSFNNQWSLTHGPMYYFIAEGLYEHGKLVSNIFVQPNKENIFTVQIGISYVIYLGLLLFGKKFWFIFLLLLVSITWVACVKIIKKFCHKINLSNLDGYIITLLIFLQPYNLNQIANFSNESLYFPLLILSFFFVINYQEKKQIFQLIVFIFVFLFGTFFRVHNLVLILSIILFFFFIREKKIFTKLILLSFVSLMILIIILYFTNLKQSLVLIKFFVSNIIEGIINSRVDNQIDLNLLKNENLVLNKLINSFSTFSFFIFINKFNINLYIKFLIVFLFLIFFIYSVIRNYKNFPHHNFFIFGSIFTFGSVLFIYLIPMFEYSYLLPSSIFVIINYYLFLKTLLKKNLYKFLFFLA